MNQVRSRGRVMLLIPGLTDGPLFSLGGRTPLETARTPALDESSRLGWSGSAPVVERNPQRRSMVGLPALLRYRSPGRLGRAALEARGLGITVPHAALALRLDFVSTFRGALADPRAGQLSDGEAELLLEALRRVETPLRMRLHRGFSYRHVAVIEDAASWELSTVSPHEVAGQLLSDFAPFGRDAGDLARFQGDARSVLGEHVVNRVRLDLGENPADAIWMWGEGTEVRLAPVSEVLGMTAAMVAGVPLLRGFAAVTGMTCPPCRERRVEGEEALRRRCALALSLTDQHDLVVVHVAGALESSRRSDPVGKVRALEAIDRAVVAPLLRWASQESGRSLLVTCDYPSSISSDGFQEEASPFALVDGGAPRGALRFDEVSHREEPALEDLEPLLSRFYSA